MKREFCFDMDDFDLKIALTEIEKVLVDTPNTIGGWHNRQAAFLLLDKLREQMELDGIIKVWND